MPVISDLELKRRLEAHHYPVPPITESTKKVLIKKLTQLDKEASQRSSARLNEYSSAEEDVSTGLTPNLRRRKIPSSNSKVSSSTNGSSNGRSTRFSNGAGRTPQLSNNSKLVNLSDGEDDDENGNQTSSDDDDDDEEEQEDAVDVGLQVSLGSPAVTNGNSTNGTRRESARFSNDTPATPVRSTASYLAKNTRSNTSPMSSTPMSFAANSPLRKAVAKNRDAFGSLGEALASLSSLSNSSNQSTSITESVVTQVPKPGESSSSDGSGSTSSGGTTTTNSGISLRQSHFHNNNKRPSSMDYASVSKFIMVFAALFFVFLAVKYFSLRPRVDIEGKLVICQDDPTSDCISPQLASQCVKMFNQLSSVLERRSAEVICKSSALQDASMEPTQIIQWFEQNEEWKDAPIERILSVLIETIEKHPLLGITVQKKGLLFENPQVDWICWTRLRLQSLAIIAKWTLLFSVVGGAIGATGYLFYRLYKWRCEVKLREQQDVFELVEQVLSLLMKHHHHLTLQDAGTPRSGGSRTSVPVNHIRDQLIAPQDRRRKNRIWQKVVQYIHNSESRVREDVQVIYGEEHKVWQWIPEVNWNPISHPGPNPYVAPLHVMAPNEAVVATAASSSMLSTASPLNASMKPNTPSTPRWQGSAFSSLNRNVAAPMFAPSSCLKVRHLFDRKMMTKIDWMKQVTEEILQRCIGAGICHVAVDKESNEGCVYIKAISNDDAAKIFKTLHGQWYRGNLVTAKYLRDERYFEKFPDARNHTKPMMCGLEVAK